jgi:hypothetical protein
VAVGKKPRITELPPPPEAVPVVAPKTAQMSIALTPLEGSAAMYVNYLEVAQTPFDFTLMGIHLPAKLTADQIKLLSDGRQIPFEPAVQITFPVSILVSLIDALIKQKELFESINNVRLGNVTESRK